MARSRTRDRPEAGIRRAFELILQDRGAHAFVTAPGRARKGPKQAPDRGPNKPAGIGAIAQLGERVNGIHEVGGSIPPGSTISSPANPGFEIPNSEDCSAGVAKGSALGPLGN